MIPKLLISKLFKLLAKGLIKEDLKIKFFIGIGNLLVKSTKNKMDDAIWKKVKSLLLVRPK